MEELDAARRLVAQASRICALTGAGMSAESGIPTFRDALTGIWARFDATQMASLQGFRANPGRVWDWYEERRAGIRQAEPNAGHRALALFAARRPGVLTLLTQNVDDLHQRAGNQSAIRLHGDILQDRWLDRCQQAAKCDVDRARPGRPPQCVDCGNLVRPDVVWFGEQLPAGAFRAAEHAVQSAQVLLVVGTSGAVWPAAGLAALARAAGAKVVIVNPRASEIDAEAHLVLRGTAADTLPALLEAWSLH